jgi:hypothetical protein
MGRRCRANCRCWVRVGGAHRGACFRECLPNARRDDIICVHNDATITTTITAVTVTSTSKATSCIAVRPELLGCLRADR